MSVAREREACLNSAEEVCRNGNGGLALRSGSKIMIASMDLGEPISYQVLAGGTKVFSSDEAEIGRVVHVSPLRTRTSSTES